MWSSLDWLTVGFEKYDPDFFLRAGNVFICLFQIIKVRRIFILKQSFYLLFLIDRIFCETLNTEES